MFVNYWCGIRLCYMDYCNYQINHFSGRIGEEDEVPYRLDGLVRDKFNYPPQKVMIKCLQQNSKLLNHQMPEILQIYRPQQHSYALFQMFSHLQLFCHVKIQCFQIHIFESVSISKSDQSVGIFARQFWI